MNILLLDIETSPNLGYIWGKYEQNVLSFEREWYILCFAAKWLSSKQTKVYALPDYESYKKDKYNDYYLMEDMWRLLDEADVIIAHNGDVFDVKKINARFIAHGMTPPSPYKTIDTLKVARKYFKFNSNHLNDLGEHLSLGKKVNTGGFKLWLDCMAGDETAWGKMKKYNKQDVVLLEKVYYKLRPWINNHPNRGLDIEEKVCPNCGSKDVQRRGYAYTKTGTFQRFACNKCGSWSRNRLVEREIKKPSLV